MQYCDFESNRPLKRECPIVYPFFLVLVQTFANISLFVYFNLPSFLFLINTSGFTNKLNDPLWMSFMSSDLLFSLSLGKGRKGYTSWLVCFVGYWRAWLKAFMLWFLLDFPSNLHLSCFQTYRTNYRHEQRLCVYMYLM